MGGRPVTNVSTPILPDAKNCVDTGRSWPPQQCISHAEKMEGQKGGRLWGNPGRRPRTDVSTPILPDAKNCVDTGR